MGQTNLNLANGFPHLTVSAGTIPVGNAVDVWRMCLRVIFSPPPPKKNRLSNSICKSQPSQAVHHNLSAMADACMDACKPMGPACAEPMATM